MSKLSIHHLPLNNTPDSACGSISTSPLTRAASPTIPAYAKPRRPSIRSAPWRQADPGVASGPPKGKPNPKNSFKPVAERLRILLDERTAPAGTTSGFPDCIRLASRRNGRQAGMRAEPSCWRNCISTRKRKPTLRILARKLGALADYYVNDAFGRAHRAHASTEGIARGTAKRAAGLLMEREFEYLGKSRLSHPQSLSWRFSAVPRSATKLELFRI